jgi:hypothetical protein
MYIFFSADGISLVDFHELYYENHDTGGYSTFLVSECLLLQVEAVCWL